MPALIRPTSPDLAFFGPCQLTFSLLDSVEPRGHTNSCDSNCGSHLTPSSHLSAQAFYRYTQPGPLSHPAETCDSASRKRICYQVPSLPSYQILYSYQIQELHPIPPPLRCLRHLFWPLLHQKRSPYFHLIMSLKQNHFGIVTARREGGRLAHTGGVRLNYRSLSTTDNSQGHSHCVRC